MKCLIAGFLGIATVLSASDVSMDELERDWNRRSFTTTMLVMWMVAQKDGVVTDDELMDIAKAGFRLLEPDDPKRRLVSRVEQEDSSRVVFVALEGELHYTGFHFWFRADGKFEKLAIAPSM